jgi:hypothetical protein
MTMIVVFFCPSRSCSEPLHMVPELPIGHLAWLARHPVHSELETRSDGTSYMASIEGTKKDHDAAARIIHGVELAVPIAD